MSVNIGTPAANLDKHNPTGRGVMAHGALGERKVARTLEKWGQNKPIVIGHSLKVPGQNGGDTDHIIASGHTLLLIDAKRWKAGYSYAMTPSHTIRRSPGMKNPKGRAFKAGKVSTPRHIQLWGEALGPEYSVAGLIVIANDVRVVYDEHWKTSPYKIVPLRELPEVLDLLFPTTQKPTDALARLVWGNIIQ